MYCSAEPLDDPFLALAHPVRRAMVERLAARVELTVAELSEPYRASPAQMTKHIAMLERARLVRRTRQGRTHRLRLQPEILGELIGWLEKQRLFWESRLDNLSEYLSRECTS